MPGPSVTVTTGPPNHAYSAQNDFTGTNLTYSGLAKSIQQPVTLMVSSVTAANPAVFTVTAHGLQTDHQITIAGASGSWAAINGKQTITRIDANTFSIAVDTSAYVGSFNGTVTTQAPQTSAACWAIQKFYYDGSGNSLRAAWANGSPAESNIWDNRATLAYQ